MKINLLYLIIFTFTFLIPMNFGQRTDQDLEEEELTVTKQRFQMRALGTPPVCPGGGRYDSKGRCRISVL